MTDLIDQITTIDTHQQLKDLLGERCDFEFDDFEILEHAIMTVYTRIDQEFAYSLLDEATIVPIVEMTRRLMKSEGKDELTYEGYFGVICSSAESFVGECLTHFLDEGLEESIADEYRAHYSSIITKLLA